MTSNRLWGFKSWLPCHLWSQHCQFSSWINLACSSKETPKTVIVSVVKSTAKYLWAQLVEVDSHDDGLLSASVLLDNFLLFFLSQQSLKTLKWPLNGLLVPHNIQLVSPWWPLTLCPPLVILCLPLNWCLWPDSPNSGPIGQHGLHASVGWYYVCLTKYK